MCLYIIRHSDIPAGTFSAIGQNCITVSFKSRSCLMSGKRVWGWINKKSTLRESLSNIQYVSELHENSVQGTKPWIVWFRLCNDAYAYLVENYNNLPNALHAWKWAVRFSQEFDHETHFSRYLVITDISHHMNPLVGRDYNTICPFIKPRWEGIRKVALVCENTKSSLYSTACWAKASFQFLWVKTLIYLQWP